MAQVGMTNYEINQQAYANIEALTAEQINKDMQVMLEWISSCGKWNYLGILCRDKHDYTLVHINNNNFSQAIQETKEVLESRGEIVDIMYIPREECYQIWVRERRTESIAELEKESTNFKWTPQVWLFMIFDATDWVIETD